MPSDPQTGGQQLLKTLNRMALVRQIFLTPGLSRADLATVVGLTKSTVSLLVRDLLAEGWLLERDVVATGEMGRRPTPLFVDPSRLLLIGAEVGIELTRLIATSLTGEVQRLIEDGRHKSAVDRRYAGWDAPAGQDLLQGRRTLAELADEVLARNTDVAPVSGRQEALENLVNRFCN